MRGARLSGWFRLEGISGIADRLRYEAANVTKAGIAVTGTNFHPRDESPNRSRREHRHETMRRNSRRRISRAREKAQPRYLFARPRACRPVWNYRGRHEI